MNFRSTFAASALVLGLVPAALLAQACGGSVTGPNPSNGQDAGDQADAYVPPGDMPDASVPDTSDPVDPNYPAKHTPIPLVDNNGGRVIQNMHIVTVTWAQDNPSMVSRLQQLDDTITQTPWWTAVSDGYCEQGGTPCIGKGTAGEHVSIADAPPSSGFTDSSMGGASSLQDWIKNQLASNADFPDPTQDTLYAIYLPDGVGISLDGTQGCTNGGFGAYHNSVTLTPKKGGTPVTTAYALIPRCGSKEATTTVSASHEFIEAATDPDVGLQALTYYMTNQEWAFAGGEVGDLCVDFTGGGNDLWKEGTFTVQRTWSNVSAKAGHDPCVPIPTGEVYFQAAPRMDQIVLKKPGDTFTVTLDAYSDAPMNDWTLSGIDFSQFQSGVSYVSASFDKTSVHNGSLIKMTLTLKKAIPQYTLFAIVSTNDAGMQHFWPIAVTPN